MLINLDNDEKMLVKELYESWRNSVSSAQVLARQAEDKRKALEKAIQHMTQIGGIAKDDFRPEEWELDLEKGTIKRTVPEPGPQP